MLRAQLPLQGSTLPKSAHMKENRGAARVSVGTGSKQGIQQHRTPPSPSPAGDAAPPGRTPVTQALGLLKDQTRSCLFIPLILFSTWLYYLLGLLWERQLQDRLIHSLPPPRQGFCPHARGPQASLGKEGSFYRASWFLPGGGAGQQRSSGPFPLAPVSLEATLPAAHSGLGSSGRVDVVCLGGR